MIWIQEFDTFTISDIAKVPCMCAVELTAGGNPTITEHVLRCGKILGCEVTADIVVDD